MKKARFFLLPFLALSMASCDFLGDILNTPTYSNYQDYLTKEEKMSKFSSMNAFSDYLDENAYFWTSSHSEKYQNTTYITSLSYRIVIYHNDNDRVGSIYFTNGNYLYFSYKNENAAIRDRNFIELDEYGTYKKETYTDEQKASLRLHRYDDGMLLVSEGKHMFFVTSDFKNVYCNETNTNVFQGNGVTKTIADSPLLTETLASLGKSSRIRLPSPKETSAEIWGGVTYSESNPNEKEYVSAYILNADILSYVSVLEENGFTVNRHFEDPFYVFYLEKGGFWCAYDEQEEIKVILRYETNLYATTTGSYDGPTKNIGIWVERMTEGAFDGRERSDATDWSEGDKARMKEWYNNWNVVIPFVALGNGVSVPNKMTKAHEGLMDGTLKLDSQCYMVYDTNPHYLLDGYDEILKSNGFTKYEPSYDLSDPEQRSAFMHIEDCKYAECYINEEQDCAIKYYWSIYYGNVIRVFKRSEMKSWLQDEK